MHFQTKQEEIEYNTHDLLHNLHIIECSSAPKIGDWSGGHFFYSINWVMLTSNVLLKAGGENVLSRYNIHILLN